MIIQSFGGLLYKKEKSFLEKVFLFPFYLLSLLYGLIVEIRVSLYAKGIFKIKRLPFPVISVGNITVGGTGKTPLVIAMARELKERGIKPAILTKGYKGKVKHSYIIKNKKAHHFSPKFLGDEPFLMAKQLNEIPIVVGSNRFKNAQMALRHFSISGFLLDDGFQYLSLYRDLDILLIDSQIGFGDYHLLPRGILREPLLQIKRADIFLITKVIDSQSSQRLEEKILNIKPSSKIFHSHYEPIGLITPKGEIEDIGLFHGKSVAALSGIGNHEYFSYLLKKCGMLVLKEFVFPDHHFYTEKDLTFIREKVKEVEYVVTTEKDMVKLNQLQIEWIPLRALRVEMRIWEEEEFYKRIMEIFLRKI